MLIVEPGGCGHGRFEEGQYYDTIAADQDECRVRVKFFDFAGRIVIHRCANPIGVQLIDNSLQPIFTHLKFFGSTASRRLAIYVLGLDFLGLACLS